ncbi:DUF6907 domain-containing protein [Streptomyces anulatus]|uniref:DUF6907 domain-containing protein n=1 Tax=Streptomyces anulatus TaxID=1892 RepID=UPI001D1930B8|nr:hypothetical protein [Streptomyces anulatus]
MSISEAAGTRQLNLGQTEPAAAPCGAYAWCAETGDHSMHLTAYVEAPTPDGYGDCVLPANVMAEDGPEGLDISVGWLDLNLTADQTRARVAELHRHLDTVAALADIVDGRPPLEPGAETYSVSAAGATGDLISSEIYHLDDPKSGEPAARIAVFGQPEADADLDVAGADQFVADLELYLPRLRAQRNHLAAILGAGGGGSVRTADGTPGHYPWCNTSACITHEYEERDGGGTYTEHIGHETSVTVSDDGHPEDTIAVAVGLGSDESFTSGTQVYVNVGDLNGLAFNPAGVDKLIGQLDTLTSALRTMRGQMDSEARP